MKIKIQYLLLLLGVVSIIGLSVYVDGRFSDKEPAVVIDESSGVRYVNIPLLVKENEKENKFYYEVAYSWKVLVKYQQDDGSIKNVEETRRDTVHLIRNKKSDVSEFNDIIPEIADQIIIDYNRDDVSSSETLIPKSLKINSIVANPCRDSSDVSKGTIECFFKVFDNIEKKDVIINKFYSL